MAKKQNNKDYMVSLLGTVYSDVVMTITKRTAQLFYSGKQKNIKIEGNERKGNLSKATIWLKEIPRFLKKAIELKLAVF